MSDTESTEPTEIQYRPWPDAEVGPYKINVKTNMVEFSDAFDKVSNEEGVTKEAAKKQAALIKEFFPHMLDVPNGYDAIEPFLATNAPSGWTKLSARAIGDKILMANTEEATMAQLAM